MAESVCLVFLRFLDILKCILDLRAEFYGLNILFPFLLHVLMPMRRYLGAKQHCILRRHSRRQDHHGLVCVILEPNRGLEGSSSSPQLYLAHTPSSSCLEMCLDEKTNGLLHFSTCISTPAGRNQEHCRCRITIIYRKTKVVCPAAAASSENLLLKGIRRAVCAICTCFLKSFHFQVVFNLNKKNDIVTLPRNLLRSLQGFGLNVAGTPCLL